jgi:hypothetical protein
MPVTRTCQDVLAKPPLPCRGRLSTRRVQLVQNLRDSEFIEVHEYSLPRRCTQWQLPRLMIAVRHLPQACCVPFQVGPFRRNCRVSDPTEAPGAESGLVLMGT